MTDTNTLTSQCKNVMCDNEAEGNSQYCSNACRAAVSRQNKRTESEAHAPEVGAREKKEEAHAPERTASLEDYNLHPEDYAKRSRPEDTDWDNRSPIPGDWDYDGVCELIDGTWQVKKPEEHTDIKMVSLDNLPSNVTPPQGQRTAATKAMTPQDLNRRIHGHGATWIQSSEYAEIIYRLLTWTVEKLEESGQHVPQWKKAEVG